MPQHAGGFGRRRRRQLLGLALGLVLFLAGGIAGWKAQGLVPVGVGAWRVPVVSAVSWRPQVPIEHAPLSPEQKRSLRLEYLRSLAIQDELIDPESVALVRWSAPENFGVAYATCVNEHGFKAVPIYMGAEYPEVISEDRVNDFNKVDYLCTSRYTLDPKYMRDWTRDQIGLVYDYYVEALIPCLQGIGFHPTGPPTDRAGYVKNFFTTSPDAKWSPVETIISEISTNLDQQAAAFKRCPPMPADIWMYGG